MRAWIDGVGRIMDIVPKPAFDTQRAQGGNVSRETFCAKGVLTRRIKAFNGEYGRSAAANTKTSVYICPHSPVAAHYIWQSETIQQSRPYTKTHAAGSAARRKYALKARIRAQRTEADYSRRRANVNVLATAAHKQISQCAALHHPEMPRGPRTDISPRSHKSARKYSRDHDKTCDRMRHKYGYERKLSAKVMHIVNYRWITFKYIWGALRKYRRFFGKNANFCG